MKWTVAKARQKFSELLRRAESEPQPIYNRDELVAAVIDRESYEEFVSWRTERDRPTVADSFDRLRELLDEDETAFETPPRTDRTNPFTDER